MASLASINVVFRANLAQFSSELQNANRQMARAGRQFQDAGKMLSASLTLPILAFGAASIKTYGDMEALQKGLIAVMGSSEEAAVEFEKLKEVAKLPGLGLQEAVKGSVNLQAAGFSADSARKSLLSFGNALATVGKGAPELELVVLALTQLNNKASGFGQDLRQLTEQLPQLRGALKAAFGTDDTAAISKLGVTGRQVVEKLTVEFEKLPKVTGGINNAFENTSDAVKISLSKIGEALNKSLNIEGLLTSLSESLLSLSDSFSELSPTVQTIIIGIAGAAAAIGPLLLGIGLVLTIMPKITLAIAAVRAAFVTLSATIAANPFTAVAVAFGAIVSAVVIATSRFTSLTDAQKEFSKAMTSGAESIAKEKTELDKNLSVARNDKLTKEQRLVAMQKINALSPEILGNLTLETINTDKAREATDKYNESLLRKAKVMAAEEKLVDVQKRLLELQLGQLDAVAPSVWQNLGNAFLSAGNSATFAALQTQTLAGNLAIEESELRKLQILLQKLIQNNGDFAGSVKNTGAQLADFNKGPLFGTIDYYKSLISAQEKIQNSLSTSNEKFAIAEGKIQDYQKAIDEISGKREPIETVVAPGLETAGIAGSVNDFEAQIEKLKKAQGEFATTSFQFKMYAAQINALEFKIKIITDDSGLIETKDKLRNTITVAEALKLRWDSIMNGFAETVGQAFEQAAENLAIGFGEFVGVLASGGATLDSIGQFLVSQIGELAIQLGKAAIQIGITMQAIKASFTSPAVAIAAGIGLVALGTIIKAAFKSQGLPQFANGGIVGGNSFYGDKILARLNSREMVLNTDQQKKLYGMINPAVTAQDVAVQIMGGFEIEGTKLKLVLDRVNNRNNRTR